MTEEKTKWKEEIRAILKEELKAIQTPHGSEPVAFGKASLALPEHEAMPESARGHKTIDEVADCPNCKPKLLAKFRPELFKEFKEKIKSKELVTCDGCGEIVEKSTEECPGCHGHKAH